MRRPAEIKYQRSAKGKAGAKRRAQSEAYLTSSRERTRRHLGIPPATRPMPELCECCGRSSTARLHLDHDHITGKFRGWLCRNCNLGIGHLRDSLAGIQSALVYLQNFGQ